MDEFSPPGSLARLVRLLAPGATVRRAWPLPGGSSAHMTTVEIALPGGGMRRLIVRQPGAAALAGNPQAAAAEFRLLRLLHAAGLPVPAPHHLDESGAIIPTPYLVIEHIDGAPDFAPADPAGFVRQLAGQLAAIHRIDGAQPTLAFLPRREERLIDGQDELRHRAARSAEEARILAALAAIPLPRRTNPVLLHGDFWPGNVLWRDGRLVGVVDWEDAEVGDPLADLAISRLDLFLIVGREALEAFTEHYRSLTAVDLHALSFWDLHAALRAAPHLDEWAAGFPALGRADLTAAVLHARFGAFTEQALARLG